MLLVFSFLIGIKQKPVVFSFSNDADLYCNGLVQLDDVFLSLFELITYIFFDFIEGLGTVNY